MENHAQISRTTTTSSSGLNFSPPLPSSSFVWQEMMEIVDQEADSILFHHQKSSLFLEQSLLPPSLHISSTSLSSSINDCYDTNDTVQLNDNKVDKKEKKPSRHRRLTSQLRSLIENMENETNGFEYSTHDTISSTVDTDSVTIASIETHNEKEEKSECHKNKQQEKMQHYHTTSQQTTVKKQRQSQNEFLREIQLKNQDFIIKQNKWMMDTSQNIDQITHKIQEIQDILILKGDTNNTNNANNKMTTTTSETVDKIHKQMLHIEKQLEAFSCLSSSNNNNIFLTKSQNKAEAHQVVVGLEEKVTQTHSSINNDVVTESLLSSGENNKDNTSSSTTKNNNHVLVISEMDQVQKDIHEKVAHLESLTSMVTTKMEDSSLLNIINNDSEEEQKISSSPSEISSMTSPSSSLISLSSRLFHDYKEENNDDGDSNNNEVSKELQDDNSEGKTDFCCSITASSLNNCNREKESASTEKEILGATNNIREGDRIKARWKGLTSYFKGHVLNVNNHVDYDNVDDNHVESSQQRITYDVKYDDGGIERNVKPDHIMLIDKKHETTT